MSSSLCYVAVSRARENNWDKPLLDVLIIDCLCHYHKLQQLTSATESRSKTFNANNKIVIVKERIWITVKLTIQNRGAESRSRISSRKRNSGSAPDHSQRTELLMCHWRYNAKYQQSRQFKNDGGFYKYSSLIEWQIVGGHSYDPHERCVDDTQITVATAFLISRWK